jgi:hypothetical protein
MVRHLIESWFIKANITIQNILQIVEDDKALSINFLT